MAGVPKMSVFIPKSRETFYARMTIPLHLWSVVDHKEVWRSLQITDKDLAQVRAEKWKTSGRRVLLVLKRDGDRMNQAMIEDLVQQWLDGALGGEVVHQAHPSSWTRGQRFGAARNEAYGYYQIVGC